jgi:hypothetical protein
VVLRRAPMTSSSPPVLNTTLPCYTGIEVFAECGGSWAGTCGADANSSLLAASSRSTSAAPSGSTLSALGPGWSSCACAPGWSGHVDVVPMDTTAWGGAVLACQVHAPTVQLLWVLVIVGVLCNVIMYPSAVREHRLFLAQKRSRRQLLDDRQGIPSESRWSCASSQSRWAWASTIAGQVLFPGFFVALLSLAVVKVVGLSNIGGSGGSDGGAGVGGGGERHWHVIGVDILPTMLFFLAMLQVSIVGLVFQLRGIKAAQPIVGSLSGGNSVQLTLVSINRTLSFCWIPVGYMPCLVAPPSHLIIPTSQSANHTHAHHREPPSTPAHRPFTGSFAPCALFLQPNVVLDAACFLPFVCRRYTIRSSRRIHFLPHTDQLPTHCSPPRRPSCSGRLKTCSLTHQSSTQLTPSLPNSPLTRQHAHRLPLADLPQRPAARRIGPRARARATPGHPGVRRHARA